MQIMSSWVEQHQTSQKISTAQPPSSQPMYLGTVLWNIFQTKHLDFLKVALSQKKLKNFFVAKWGIPLWLLKFMFPKKTTNRQNLHCWCDIYLVTVKSMVKILSNFVTFLENMNFSQLASTNDFYYFFREKSMLHTSYEKCCSLELVYLWSNPYKERSHLQDSNQTMCDKSDPALFCRNYKSIRLNKTWMTLKLRRFWWVN